jgi:hypothetical protein
MDPEKGVRKESEKSQNRYQNAVRMIRKRGEKQRFWIDSGWILDGFWMNSNSG